MGTINNEVIYDIAEKDVNPYDAIMILKKRTYQGYLHWLQKTGKDLNLRLSPNKLITRLFSEQYIMLHSKYHPYAEELNLFVLKVEVRGNRHAALRIIYY